jgi:uncharacterized C2H2 Zn-finger protein
MKSLTIDHDARSCHSESKTHLCQICGKGFNNAENFKYHMRRHSGEKPLQCPTCEKQFAEPWAYRKHLRLHTGYNSSSTEALDINNFIGQVHLFAFYIVERSRMSVDSAKELLLVRFSPMSIDSLYTPGFIFS